MRSKPNSIQNTNVDSGEMTSGTTSTAAGRSGESLAKGQQLQRNASNPLSIELTVSGTATVRLSVSSADGLPLSLSTATVGDVSSAGGSATEGVKGVDRKATQEPVKGSDLEANLKTLGGHGGTLPGGLKRSPSEDPDYGGPLLTKKSKPSVQPAPGPSRSSRPEENQVDLPRVQDTGASARTKPVRPRAPVQSKKVVTVPESDSETEPESYDEDGNPIYAKDRTYIIRANKSR